MRTIRIIKEGRSLRAEDPETGEPFQIDWTIRRPEYNQVRVVYHDSKGVQQVAVKEAKNSVYNRKHSSFLGYVKPLGYCDPKIRTKKEALAKARELLKAEKALGL